MKLIAFLFLLLTLLSCNSSGDDAISIQNSITAEAQLQQMNVMLYDNGNRYASYIQEEYHTIPRNQEMIYKSSTLFLIINKIEEIDSLTANMIHSIDELKISLLKEADENYTIKPELTALPTFFDLSTLKNAGNADAAESLLNSTDNNLFDQFKTYRSELVKAVGKTAVQRVIVTDINDYKNDKDLEEKVNTQILVPNPVDNRQVITDLYVLLTLPNNLVQNGKKTPWMQAVFQHSNLIGAITQLTILQNKILAARASALQHVSSIGCMSEYGFNKIMPFAQGPSLIYEGETAEITVGMAAFDSYNQPEVTVQSIDGEVLEAEGGIRKVRIKPKKGLQKIRGTVSIKNKSGIKKTTTWEWDIRVLPKKS